MSTSYGKYLIFITNLFFCFHRPVSPPSAAKAVVRRSSVLLKGVEVTLDFKFKAARPSLLVPLETQLKLGEIASHSVAPDMAAGCLIRHSALYSHFRPPAVTVTGCKYENHDTQWGKHDSIPTVHTIV